MTTEKDYKNFIIIGCGERVRKTILPALHTIKEVYIKNIIAKKERSFFYSFNNKKYTLNTNKIQDIDFTNVNYIYLGIPNDQIYKTLLKVIKISDTSKINLIVDTPPIGLKNIINISIFKKFKECFVMEESPFIPELNKIKNLEQEKYLKKIEKIMYFHSGYMYHSFSQIKELFKVNYFNFIRKVKTSSFTEEIKIYNGYKNIAVIYNPRDYSVGRYLISFSDGYISNYNLKLKNKDFKNSFYIKHKYDKDFYYGFNILQNNNIISYYHPKFKYNLIGNQFIQSQINSTQKEIGVRDYFIRLFANKNYEYKETYSIVESTYDYICTKLINKYGLFFDIKIPFTKKSIINLFLEFFYNL